MNCAGSYIAVNRCLSASSFFTDYRSPPSKIFEKPYVAAGGKRKSALERILISILLWGAVHEDTFLQLQETLKSAVYLAHIKDDYIIPLFTVAFEKFSPGIVTKVGETETEKDVENQVQVPLAFRGDHVSRAQKNWNPFEK